MGNKQSELENPLWIIKLYPWVLLIVAVSLNYLFDTMPLMVQIPSLELITLISCSAFVLVANHTWIMTVTELTRNRHKVFATPEEWIASGRLKSDITKKAEFEIERCLNTHRNTTENVVYYILLLFVFSLVSPNPIAAWVWILMFPISRVGYSYSYFSGKDNSRGVFMSLSLLSMYGMASYLAVALLS
jgi:uncharacterized membrane protein YecN with MAPEG domain